MLNDLSRGVSLRMKYDRFICLINEAFMCNVLHSEQTETRILFDVVSDIQLLRVALKTQNIACVHIHCRGMINSLLSGMRQFTFILVFFGKQPTSF